MKTIIKNGTVVNEGHTIQAHVVINDDLIEEILPATENPRSDYDKIIDATGCLVMPGVIDSHVHFREPGLTHKADIDSESRAAAYGGVTTYFDMPNTNPQTTTIADLIAKQQIAAAHSHVNYAFFYGATDDNATTFSQLDVHTIPGIKLFMGSSTGNMLVERREALLDIFRTAHELNLPVMAHCEDTTIINRNMQEAQQQHGDDPDVKCHPLIRSEEACLSSTAKAVELARETGAHLHVAHITTARELALLDSCNVTAEATVAHLMFTDADYATKGTLIKCNPAVKTAADRAALRKALSDGTIATIGTDHAPHALSEKKGGSRTAVSGMPMLQFSLVAMLSLVDEGVLSLPQLVTLMCHNPARLFRVSRRGYLRPGYKADIVIARHDAPWVLQSEDIQSKCSWSPLEGTTFHWRVLHTLCNGHHILDNTTFDESYRAEPVRFRE